MTWHPAQWGSLLYIKESGKTVKELMVVWGGYYLIQVFLRNTDAGNDLNQQLPLWQTCNNHHALCFLWWEHLAIIKRWQSHSESTINEPNYIFHHFSNIFSKTSLVKTTHKKKICALCNTVLSLLEDFTYKYTLEILTRQQQRKDPEAASSHFRMAHSLVLMTTQSLSTSGLIRIPEE